MLELLAALSCISILNQISVKNVSLRLYPSVEDAKALKESDLEEFERKMKARQEVYNIGVSWENL